MHTTDFKQILREEEAYIRQRRKRVHITEGEAAEGKWGIVFSNGGARASTLMLGVMRKLMSEGIDFFRRIDYLSVVGGSSFMGSAFVSLLTGEKSTDKRGLFGTRPHNSPFLPETNAAGEGKGVKPDLQMGHFRKHIKDIQPHFWKQIGGTPGLFGIGASGVMYAFSVLVFLMIAFMSLHHLYFYLISHCSLEFGGELFQQFIDKNKPQNPGEWGDVLNLFSFSGGLTDMLKEVAFVAIEPAGWWLGGVAAIFGAMMSFIFFVVYLRPTLQIERRHDVHIEIKIKEFNYFGFGLTYFSLLVFGFVVHFSGGHLDYRLAFAVPVFLTFGMLVSGVIFGFFNRLQYTNDDNRRAFMAEIVTTALAMFFVSLAFPVLLITLLLIGGWWTFLISIACFFIGTILVFRRIRQLGRIKAYRRFGNSLPNFSIGFSIVLLFASTGKAILKLADINKDGVYQIEWFIAGFIVPIFLLCVFSLFNKKNRNNLHSYFKNRKSDIFLITDTNNLKYPARDDSKLLLHNLAKDNYYAPYFLLNATLNVHNSAAPNTRKKRGTHFYFSKDYIGSEKTGYVRTEAFEDGKLTLADAMMTAAGNYHSGMGIHGFYSQAFLFTLLNLRLGRWLLNPWYYRSKAEHSRGSSRFMNFLREYVNRFSTRALHVNISSGIHTGDHWGLTALLRRQCENIVLFDFRSPKDLVPGELNMTDIRAIAAKHGASIGDVEIGPLQKKDINGRELCEANVISATLTYESGGKQGRLYYIKLEMSEALPNSILEYYDQHPEFPFKFTSNMQSPDLQFNTFVQLGEQLAEQFYELCKKDDVNDFDKIIGERLHQLDEKEKIKNLDCEGLKETEQLYVERLNFFRKEKVIASDVAKKFELDKEIEEMEREIADIRAEMMQKGCVEVEADVSENS